MEAEANGSLTEVYEVETILDYKKQDNKDWYLVKWKNWSEDSSTWEPVEHLHCRNLLAEFHRGRSDAIRCQQERMKHFLSAMDAVCSGGNGRKTSKAPTDVAARRRPSAPVKPVPVPVKCAKAHPQVPVRNGFQDSLDGDCLEFLEDFKSAFKNGKWMFERVKKGQFLVYKRKRTKLQAFEDRRALNQKLKAWEHEVNRICRRFHEKPIRVENYVDSEGPPANFKYVTECFNGRNVVIPKEPLIGCTCTDCKANGSQCCAAGMGASFAYTRTGKVKIAAGLPIYECNSRCACSASCPNRVVQKGRQVEISIFRTNNGRGWGVKTLSLIEKNSFVMEYVGEIIKAEEAERRGRRYDMEGMTYLFDLDFNDSAVQYVIDAKQYGNASHFINHSCDPNLTVYAVWIEHLDVFLPRIAFFARRDIQPNEELTFDYVMSSGGRDSDEVDGDTVEDSSSNTSQEKSASGDSRDGIDSLPTSRLKGRIPCKCGSDRCRGFLYFATDS